MLDTDYPQTLADVNKAVRPIGVRFVRHPAGYYYPIALDGSWAGEGVYTYRVTGLTIGGWMKEAEEQKKKFQRTAAEEAVKKVEMGVLRQYAEKMGAAGKNWLNVVTSMLRSGGGTVRVMKTMGDFADVIANHPMGHILGPVQVPVKVLRTAAGEDEIRRAIKNAVTKGSSVDDKIGTISMITEWIHGGLVSNHGKFIVTDIRRPVFTMKNFNDMSFTADIVLIGEPDFEKSQNKKYIWNLKGDTYRGRIAQFQMVHPWTDAYGNPAQDYMQPLRRRPDYGETEMDITEKVMGMDDNDLVTREEVGQMCPMCAEKMAKEGLKAVRAYIIKAALGKTKKTAAGESKLRQWEDLTDKFKQHFPMWAETGISKYPTEMLYHRILGISISKYPAGKYERAYNYFEEGYPIHSGVSSASTISDSQYEAIKRDPIGGLVQSLGPDKVMRFIEKRGLDKRWSSIDWRRMIYGVAASIRDSAIRASLREIRAIEFPTQDAYDKYMKEHPDADKSKHRVVETKKEPAKKEEPTKKEEPKKVGGKSVTTDKGYNAIADYLVNTWSDDDDREKTYRWMNEVAGIDKPAAKKIVEDFQDHLIKNKDDIDYNVDEYLKKHLKVE